MAACKQSLINCNIPCALDMPASRGTRHMSIAHRLESTRFSTTNNESLASFCMGNSDWCLSLLGSSNDQFSSCCRAQNPPTVRSVCSGPTPRTSSYEELQTVSSNMTQGLMLPILRCVKDRVRFFWSFDGTSMARKGWGKVSSNASTRGISAGFTQVVRMRVFSSSPKLNKASWIACY